MKYLFIFCLLFICFPCMSQKPEVFESHYSFNKVLKIPGLEFVKNLQASSEIIAFSNGSLVLIAMEPFKVNMPGTNGNDDELRDTLFYETEKKIVYNVNKREAFRYGEVTFNFKNLAADTIVSSRNDTSIIISKTIPFKVIALPRLARLPYGILEFKTETVTMKLIGYKKSGFNLEAIMKRVKSYKLTDTPFQWSF